jgi:hypothetical protein
MQDGVPVDPLTKELSLEKKEKVLQLLNKLKKETGTPNEQND